MDTFFYAEGEDNDPVLPSQVDQAPDYNVWNHHEKGKEETGMFAVIPEVLINEASGTRQKLVEKKEALQELKFADWGSAQAALRRAQDGAKAILDAIAQARRLREKARSDVAGIEAAIQTLAQTLTDQEKDEASVHAHFLQILQEEQTPVN